MFYGLTTDTKLSVTDLRYAFSAFSTTTYVLDWVQLFIDRLEKIMIGSQDILQGGLITLLAEAAEVPSLDELKGFVES